MSQSCLLVIDVQESFRHRPYWQDNGTDAFLKAQNALIALCQTHNVPIVRVFHVDGPTTAENPFALESGHIVPLQGLAPFEAAHTVIKHRHSALVGTGLDVWLVQHGMTDLIISGIRTEQCCETTTRHASDLGYRVTFIPEATLTFDMKQIDGATLSANDIKSRTVTVLHQRFAQISSVDAALGYA